MIDERNDEHYAVEAIQYSAVPGNQSARILNACVTLERRLHEIADCRQKRDGNSQSGHDPKRHGNHRPQSGHRYRRANDAADNALNRFLGAYRLAELMPPQRHPREVGEGIAGPRPNERHPKPDAAKVHFSQRRKDRPPGQKRHAKKNKMG